MILLLWLLIWRPIQRTYRRRVRRDDKSVLVGIFVFLFSISPHDRSHCTPCRLSVPSCRCCCCGSWLVVFLVLFEFLPLASRKTNATQSFPNTWRGGIVDPSASSSSFFFFYKYIFLSQHLLFSIRPPLAYKIQSGRSLERIQRIRRDLVENFGVTVGITLPATTTNQAITGKKRGNNRMCVCAGTRWWWRPKLFFFPFSSAPSFGFSRYCKGKVIGPLACSRRARREPFNFRLAATVRDREKIEK